MIDFTVVVPVRNRYGSRLRNCLRSIELQTVDAEIFIADYGSTTENHIKTMKLAPKSKSFHYLTDEPWSLSAARNIGLRRTDTEYAMVFDADLIMEPCVLESLLVLHKMDPNTYISTQVVLLDTGSIDIDALELPRDYEQLKHAKATYRSEGWGGLGSAHRDWWYESRGFDERMKWWGWEDVDMWKRVGRAGLKRVRLSDMNMPETQVYHQWHPNTQLEALQRQNEEILNHIILNERLSKRTPTIKRNDENWGKHGK